MEELNINCPARVFFTVHPDGPPARAPIWRLVSNTESHTVNDCSAKIASEQPTPKAMYGWRRSGYCLYVRTPQLFHSHLTTGESNRLKEITRKKTQLGIKAASCGVGFGWRFFCCFVYFKTPNLQYLTCCRICTRGRLLLLQKHKQEACTLNNQMSIPLSPSSPPGTVIWEKLPQFYPIPRGLMYTENIWDLFKWANDLHILTYSIHLHFLW